MTAPKSLLALALGAAVIAPHAADASVRVYGEATSTGPTISVQLYADITAPAIVSHTCKLFYPASQLRVASATHNAAVWFFHDGTRTVPYPAPESSTPGEVQFTGAHLDARNPLTGVTGNHVLLGTVVFNRTTESTPSFDMTIGRAGQFASFVAVNGTVLEAQAGQVSMQSVSVDPTDSDLDGLNDRWEETYFGTTKGVFYTDDPDKDGVNNRAESQMGSDPTDAKSYLHLDITTAKEKLMLEWPSAEGRSYTIEGAKSLGRFSPIREGISATPPLNSFTLDRSEFGDILFLRLRVEADTRR